MDDQLSSLIKEVQPVQRKQWTELEKQLAYVKWLKSQNESRMRERRAYVKRLEQRDLRETFDDELPRAERLRLVRKDEENRPLKISAEEMDKIVRENRRAKEKERQWRIERKKTSERSKKIHIQHEEMRERNITYRQKKLTIIQQYHAFQLSSDDEEEVEEQ